MVKFEYYFDNIIFKNGSIATTTVPTTDITVSADTFTVKLPAFPQNTMLRYKYILKFVVFLIL